MRSSALILHEIVVKKLTVTVNRTCTRTHSHTLAHMYIQETFLILSLYFRITLCGRTIGK